MKKTSQAPLFKIGKRVRAKVYKARFRPFKATRYLNIAALKKAKKAIIEIGSIEAPGVTATLAAEIHNGAITRIRPVTCRNCAKEKAQVKSHRAELKKVCLEALKRVRDRSLPVVRLPIPITRARIWIPIGPIIVVIGWPPDICIVVSQPDGSDCIYCIFLPTICVGPIIFD
jgi:hypothetical protein